jgi:hypothetical protein
VNSVAGSKKKRSRYPVRLGLAGNFIAANVELPSYFREFFERSLALQIYGKQGPPVGTRWAEATSPLCGVPPRYCQANVPSLNWAIGSFRD